MFTVALIARFHIHLEPPDPPKFCELRNDTIFEVVCIPGNDGGLVQYFLLEVVGGNPVTSEKNQEIHDNSIINNEIATMNDQVSHFSRSAAANEMNAHMICFPSPLPPLNIYLSLSRPHLQATTAPLRRIQESIPEFKLYELEPGREYQFLVYAVNAKGRSHPPVVMFGKNFADLIGPHGNLR